MLNNQLRWRCRRGTQELDLLLLAYLDQHYSGTGLEQQQCFHEFLDLEDSLLQHYLLGNTVPDRSDYAVLVEQILSVKKQ
jgi:antitoxin CptB